jgi:hypothetical protein
MQTASNNLRVQPKVCVAPWLLLHAKAHFSPDLLSAVWHATSRLDKLWNFLIPLQIPVEFFL